MSSTSHLRSFSSSVSASSATVRRSSRPNRSSRPRRAIAFDPYSARSSRVASASKTDADCVTMHPTIQVEVARAVPCRRWCLRDYPCCAALAPDVHDVPVAVEAELAAQATGVGVERARRAHVAKAPDLAQELVL